MAIAIGAAGGQTVTVKMKDFRGQSRTVILPLAGATTDADIIAILSDLDLISNAYIVSAHVTTSRPVTGQKVAALNALERNISEIMELTFVGANVVGKASVYKSIAVPALKAAIENNDGSPAATGVNASLDDFVAKLAADLTYVKSDNTPATGMVYDPASSHHITVSDIVDAV